MRFRTTICTDLLSCENEAFINDLARRCSCTEVRYSRRAVSTRTVRKSIACARDGDTIAGDGTSARYGYDHLAFEVDDVDAAHKALAAKGYVFFIQPQIAQGMKIAFFRGPDNIPIELVQVLS